MSYNLLAGDVLDITGGLPDNTYSAVFCDPPYGIKFMSKIWDHGVPSVAVWEQVYRVCKPGAVLMAFGGDRTHHRLMVNIEDAGWQIKTCLYWVFGSGFPKSRNIGKAIRAEFSEDALCACESHCQETTQDSQADYQSLHRLHDEQLPSDQDSGLGDFPSRSGVHEHNRDDLHVDALASRQANTGLDATSAPPSIDYYSRPLAHQREDYQLNGNIQSGREKNRLHDGLKGLHKTETDKSSISHSDGDSVSFSSNPHDKVTHSHMSYCTTCGKIKANAWDGWGTALKPAVEIIIMAMKPLESTYAHSALTYGTGALNIDGCRVPISDGATMARNNKPGDNGWKNSSGGANNAALHGEPSGRWPANLIHSGDPEVMEVFDRAGERKLGGRHITRRAVTNGHGGGWGDGVGDFPNDTCSAARFFYCAKASSSERNAGLDGSNPHPTVKPLSLCEYLAKLIVPPESCRDDAQILIPYSGVNSEVIGAMLAGWKNITAIEKDEDYHEIGKRRLAWWKEQSQPSLLEVP